MDRPALIRDIYYLGKLNEAINTFNTKYLKELKNVGLIPDAVAIYEESKNVAIAGAVKWP